MYRIKFDGVNFIEDTVDFKESRCFAYDLMGKKLPIDRVHFMGKSQTLSYLNPFGVNRILVAQNMKEFIRASKWYQNKETAMTVLENIIESEVKSGI